MTSSLHAPWDFIIAAYSVTGLGLAAITIAVILNLRHWARRAREDS